MPNSSSSESEPRRDWPESRTRTKESRKEKLIVDSSDSESSSSESSSSSDSSYSSSSSSTGDRSKKRKRSPKKRKSQAKRSRIVTTKKSRKVSLKKSRILRSLMARGISSSEARELRESFNLCFEHSKIDLRCPTLDNHMFYRLREKRNGSATKKSIDSVEKSLSALHYKIADIARPLLHLWLKKSAKNVRSQIFSVLKLWSTAFVETTKLRRRNILRQLYPNYLSMLDDPDAFDEQEFLSLFGSKFTNSMVQDAENAATMRSSKQLNQSSNFRSKSWPTSGRNSYYKDRPCNDYRKNGKSHQRKNNGRYVRTPSPPPLSLTTRLGAKIGGRLQFFASEWGKFSRDPWILNTVSEGLRLEFIREPAQSLYPFPTSMNGAEFDICDKEIMALLEKGAIRQASSVGFVSSVFAIPKKSGGFRPVINLKALNEFMFYKHFQMENLSSVRQLVQKGNWLAKIDLTDAYLTVPVHPEDQHYLQFRWEKILYQFVCMPFGLSSAPRTFTKLLKPLIAFLRGKGIRLVVYLDDMLIVGESEDQLESQLKLVTQVLESVGFVINLTKSIKIPTQELEFLGFWVDAYHHTVSIPREKVDMIKKKCTSLLSVQVCTLRDLASLLGLFTWAVPEVPFGRANYRRVQNFYLQEARKNRGNLQTKVRIPSQALADLEWWRNNLAASSSPLSPSPTEVTIFTDASKTGWEATCNGVSTGGPWTPDQAAMHINCLELLAGLYGLMCFADSSPHSTVELAMDNTTAVSYANKMGGTRAIQLSNLATRIAH